MIRRPHLPRTRYQVLYSSSSQQVPRSYCCTKRLTPLESSHGHHLPARAASARAARGRRFDPKRPATTSGCRACSASRERRVGPRAGSNSGSLGSSSTRSSPTTPDDGSHIHRIVRPRCRIERSWLRAGRVYVRDRFRLCTQQLNWCAVYELSFSCLFHEYCCCGTCYTTV